MLLNGVAREYDRNGSHMKTHAHFVEPKNAEHVIEQYFCSAFKCRFGVCLLLLLLERLRLFSSHNLISVCQPLSRSHLPGHSTCSVTLSVNKFFFSLGVRLLVRFPSPSNESSMLATIKPCVLYKTITCSQLSCHSYIALGIPHIYTRLFIYIYINVCHMSPLSHSLCVQLLPFALFQLNKTFSALC